ncbi:MAG: energy-coupled thiamine transporter ThiT [Firmicutes bacterium]|jgi:thiamine transporter|nr:energy-coupled thiamine transporter ThiT [Bacillota bacterium]MDH7495925.1 energy-coupled thiamine transporter ThiT [Bacillota bacterium]
MNNVNWLVVVEAAAALALLIALIRLTRPAQAAGQRRGTTQVVTEVGVTVALAAVLSLIRVFRMPQGGSVSLEMVPVFYVALRRGGATGILAGLVLGMVKLALGPYVVHPLQFLMDYPLAFAALGVSGFFSRAPLLGVLVGGAARFLMHVLSGVAFFASYAPEGSNVWVYSLTYNASYMVPEVALAMILMLLLGVGFARGRKRLRPGHARKV